jgi:hypothetical protein
MPVRTDEEVREALEAQADDNANAGELLDILRWSSSGNAAQKRARLLSFLDGPASRRRAGWLDLLLQVHAAGATSFNDLEPDELEIDDEDREGDDDARLPVGSVSVLLDLVDRLPRNAEHAPAFSVLPDLVRMGSGDLLSSVLLRSSFVQSWQSVLDLRSPSPSTPRLLVVEGVDWKV